jgi:hypothetical protein
MTKTRGNSLGAGVSCMLVSRIEDECGIHDTKQPHSHIFMFNYI